MRKKAKYVFMKKVKVKEYTKKVERKQYKTDISEAESEKFLEEEVNYQFIDNGMAADPTYNPVPDQVNMYNQPQDFYGQQMNGMYGQTRDQMYYGENVEPQGYFPQDNQYGYQNAYPQYNDQYGYQPSNIMFSDDIYDNSEPVPVIQPTNHVSNRIMFDDAMYANNTPDEEENQYSDFEYIKNKNKKDKPDKTKKFKSNSNELGTPSVLDDSLYEQKRKIRLKNTDNLERLNIAGSFRVTRKEALTSIEAKTPFIVGKMEDATKPNSKNKKPKPFIEEHDIVYRTIPKIRHSDNISARRVGYLQVADKPSYQHFNWKKTKHILGIINDEYIITKKKASNQRKIGYIKLAEDDSGIDKYVEVTKKKSTPFLLILFIMIGILLFMKNFDSIEDWHVDFSKFNVYKTEEQIEYNQRIVTINHNAEVKLEDGQIKLNLMGNKGVATETEIMLKIKILDSSSKEVLYESEILEAGKLIQYIPITKDYRQGEYTCEIICDSYNAETNGYIGTINSDFIMKVNRDSELK